MPKRRCVGLGQHALRDQLGRRLDAVDEAAEPEQRLQVAQAALALLDVGLEQVAAVAGALVAGVALGELGLDEHAVAAVDDVVLEAPLELGEQRLVAPQEARLEQARADLQVGAREPQALVERAGRLADLEAEIPQPVEQELDHLLGMRGALVGMQEQQVDVGVRRQLAAAVAADRSDHEALAGGRVGHAEDAAVGEVEQAMQQHVDQAAAAEHHRLAVVVGLELPLQPVLVARRARP